MLRQNDSRSCRSLRARRGTDESFERSLREDGTNPQAPARVAQPAGRTPGKFTLQTYLNELAPKFSKSVLQKVRVYLNSILGEAVELKC
jgi:hypothetical protein